MVMKILVLSFPLELSFYMYLYYYAVIFLRKEQSWPIFLKLFLYRIYFFQILCHNVRAYYVERVLGWVIHKLKYITF